MQAVTFSPSSFLVSVAGDDICPGAGPAAKDPRPQRISLVLWMLPDLSVLCFHHVDFFVIVCFLFWNLVSVPECRLSPLLSGEPCVLTLFYLPSLLAACHFLNKCLSFCVIFLGECLVRVHWSPQLAILPRLWAFLAMIFICYGFSSCL